MDAGTIVTRVTTYLKRSLWIQVLVAMQIILLVLGVILNSQGDPNTGFATHMDFMMVSGGLAGALALYVFVFTLLLVAIDLGFRVRDYMDGPVEF